MKKSLVEKRQAGRKKAIFALVRSNDNALSRNDICKITKYSMTTVSAVVDEWIREGFLSESESSEVRIGRKPVLLSVNPMSIFFAGIECSSWGVNFTVVDASQNVFYHDNVRFHQPSAEDILQAMDAVIEKFTRQLPDIWEKIPSLTVSLPGKIDQKAGVGIAYTSVPDWKRVDVRSRLAHWGKKLYFINNVDGMLLGYCTQNAMEDKSVLFVLIRNGTGTRLYSNKTLLSQYGVLCEMGHMKAPNSNRLCYCGKRGCFDAEVTITAIRNKIYEALSMNRLPAMREKCNGDLEKIDILMFLNLVAGGDRDACEIFDGVAAYIGELLSNLLSMFTADTAVLCTDLCREKQRLQQIIEPMLPQSEDKKVGIDYVLPLDEFSSLGSAIVGYERYFEIDEELENDL